MPTGAYVSSLTQKFCDLQITDKEPLEFYSNMAKPKIEVLSGLNMPRNPCNNLLFHHIDGLKFFLNFWVQILIYIPLLQEGTIAGFPALGSSHHCPWTHWKIRSLRSEVECASSCNNSWPDDSSCLKIRLKDSKVHQIILHRSKICTLNRKRVLKLP